MTEDEWKQFLGRWNNDLLRSPVAPELPEEAKVSRWLGLPPATEGEISQTEQRLGIALPPSYRAFLKVSNGWGRLTHAVWEVNSVEQVNWFRKKNRDWIRAYTTPNRMPEDLPDDQYFAYGEYAASFRAAHLKETLQITEVGDAAVYLLNPQVITNEGEWEAWFFANWLPGALRYRSFEELMRAEYARFAGANWSPSVGLAGALPAEYTGSPGSPRRRLVQRKRRREPKLLNKALSKWTADELLEILRNADFGIIHGEAIHGLGLLGDTKAVEPLIALLRAGYQATGAAAALKRLAPQRVREELLQILSNDWRSRVFDVRSFAAIMTELRDARVVPLLIEMLHDESPQTARAGDFVGPFLAQFGRPGLDALAHALKNDSALVRTRAVHALSASNRGEARDLIAPMVEDPDPAIREAARIALDFVLPRKPA